MTDPSEDRTHEWDAEPMFAAPDYPQAPDLICIESANLQRVRVRQAETYQDGVSDETLMVIKAQLVSVLVV